LRATGTKVLIVDDEEVICTLFSEILQQYGYQTATETDGRKTLERLWQEHFDVLLLDLMLPGINGIQLLRQLRQSFEDLPVVMVTGHGTIETAVESIQAGASEFVTKPVDAVVLDLRIQKAIEYVHTKRLANTDALTGLCNYRSFQERLAQEIVRAQRYYRPLSLIMIDVDHFKAYNDTWGHLQGDQVLATVAQLLRQTSRNTDIVARYGGEEFVLILPETDAEKAETLGYRLCEQVESRTFPGEEQLPGKTLTISVGLTSYTPPDSKESFIQKADKALYQAKRLGRNRVIVWRRDSTAQSSSNAS
jgi:two-component system cell cycle response regulator